MVVDIGGRSAPVVTNIYYCSKSNKGVATVATETRNSSRFYNKDFMLHVVSVGCIQP